jgi:SAM-dependent methyltransferase
MNSKLLGLRYKGDGESLRTLNPIQEAARDRVKHKLVEGSLAVESFPCPGCDQSEFQPLSAKDRYGLPCSVVICCVCGLVQTNPQLTEQACRDFYLHDYRELYLGRQNLPEVAFRDERQRGVLLFRYLERTGLWRQLPANPYIYEVGCGAGGILASLRDRGARVGGCDLDEDTVNYGVREHSLGLSLGTFQDVQLKSRPDLVIYSHVFEHLANPDHELGRLQHVLGDGGRVYVEVPGVRWLRRASYDFLDTLQNAHTFYFTLASLKRLFGRHGFRLKQGDEYIRAVFEANSGHEEVPLVNQYAKTLEYLKRVERERKFVPYPPMALLRHLRLLRRFVRGGFR